MIVQSNKCRLHILKLAIEEANRSIDSFIAAYGGCADIEARVDLWEDY